MSDHLHLIFAPFLSAQILIGLVVLALGFLSYALFKGSRGTFLRGLLLALILLILANPSLVTEKHTPLKDTALLVIDDSGSMKISDRSQQSSAAVEEMTKKLAAFPDLDVETLHVTGQDETDLFRALEQKLSSIPPDRLAGIIAVTDGEVHDLPSQPLKAPFHVLLAGHQGEVDRRLIVKEAPAYGIVGKTVALTLRIEDQPKSQSDTALVHFSRDGNDVETESMPVGKDIQFNVPIDHPGQNLFVFRVDELPKELTTLNNLTAVSVNGIRDRLRVLLVSGQPHIGGRTWRNFLKADGAVDLVHFTILRSPLKMDATPNTELSLIAFPVHELFATKLKSFDLVIFDRFRQQSLVQDEYLENIAKYVENGGALLISSSTDEGIPPLALSPLARILPTTPTGKLLTGAFVPSLTEVGNRHPVTSSLTTQMPRSAWGHWFRQIETSSPKGDVLMTGLNDRPLLVLDHVGEGRVAQFLSDQFWLWSRGFEGGGPQAELLRRVAHWLVQEPELDETALRVHSESTADGWQFVITKQSLRGDSAVIQLTGPDNETRDVTLLPAKEAGVLTASVPVKETGLYHLKDGTKEIIAIAGPTRALEFGAMHATDTLLAPIVKSTGGGLFWLDTHPLGPDIRRVHSGSAESGWDWIGLKQNGQFKISGSHVYPLLPPVILIVLLLAFAMGAWWREGKS